MESSASYSHCSSSSQHVSGRSTHSPVPYRERPLEYAPPVMCLCPEPRMAARWISWSDANPGRRYLKCQLSRDGGCSFFQWYEEGTTPFLRQLLVDLRDKVRGLCTENRKLLEVQTRQELGVYEQREQMRAMKGIAMRKDALITEQKIRIRKLEKERLIWMVVICVCFSMFLFPKLMAM